MILISFLPVGDRVHPVWMLGEKKPMNRRSGNPGKYRGGRLTSFYDCDVSTKDDYIPHYSVRACVCKHKKVNVKLELLFNILQKRPGDYIFSTTIIIAVVTILVVHQYKYL